MRFTQTCPADRKQTENGPALSDVLQITCNFRRWATEATEALTTNIERETIRSMSNPLEVALSEISETKQLLQTLIISSESFDYPKAKKALAELDRKVRHLGKVQAKLVADAQSDARQPKIRALDFRQEAANPQPRWHL
jgi:hypothetical protein